MTNYEKIKTMSVEEMAEGLHDITTDCDVCPVVGYCIVDHKTCKETMQEWLESEVEEDG